MDYLELVNRAILEAGKDQDPLTEANFTSPPNPRMYNRFKGWVQESYDQLQMARNEWEFKSGRAVVSIFPAISVVDGSAGGGTPVGLSFVGDDTGYELEVVGVNIHSGTWLAGTAVSTLYFETAPNYQFHIGENFEEDVAIPDASFTVVGIGRYEPSSLVADYGSIKTNTVYLQDAEATATSISKVTYVDWDLWTDWCATADTSAGGPYFFTRAPDGYFCFYPYLNKEYTLIFEYDKADQSLDLENADDVPTLLPDKYHMAIVWMAVEKSGMYDRDRAIVSRAQKELRFYRDRMERNLMPDMSFAPSRF